MPVRVRPWAPLLKKTEILPKFRLKYTINKGISNEQHEPKNERFVFFCFHSSFGGKPMEYENALNNYNIYLNLEQKREDALDEVENNLIEYSKALKKYSDDICDYLPSTSTSIIKMPEKTNNASSAKMILRAIEKQATQEKIINRLDRILNRLSENQRNLLVERFISNKFENNSLNYIALIKTYEIIAILDNDIDFSLNDYASLKMLEKKGVKKKVFRSIRNDVISILSLYDELDENNKDLEIYQVLEKFPQREYEAMKRYLKRAKEYQLYKMTRAEQYSVSRFIVLFAFYYSKISISENLTVQLLKEYGRASEYFIRKYVLEVGAANHE